MSDHEHSRLAPRIQATIDAPSDRLDDLVKATKIDPNSDLRFGDWRGLDLTGADLRGFDFTGADLTDTVFENAMIDGAIFDHATYELAALRKAADFNKYSKRDSARRIDRGRIRDKPKAIKQDKGPPQKPQQIMRQYDLIERVRRYNPNTNEALINRAYVYAMKAHGEQHRASDDPYFSRPIEVAAILTDLKLDDATIAAALLHDTIEDTKGTRAEIEDLFGSNIGTLVNQLSKLKGPDLANKETDQAESLRKLLLSAAGDARVLLVKFAERLHNMRTLQLMPPGERRRYAYETLEVYAPLAGRMGMHEMCEELDDLAFREIYPEAHAVVSGRLNVLAERNRLLISDIEKQITKKLADRGIKARVVGRKKRAYSIWRKMERKSVGFEQLSDIFGFHVVVNTANNCYTALNIVHQTWSVVPGRFKDYISTPKLNDYQALHTTVIGPGQQRVELQIRTIKMQQIAEYGIAAHALYKDNADSPTELLSRESTAYAWLRRTIERLAEGSSSEEFLEHTKLELSHDQIFCFTPRGKLIALPRKATPIDFAYAVHTDVGNATVGCKINGQIAPLTSDLVNGDEVEIITSKAQTAPPAAWESLVRTGKARAAIRSATGTPAIPIRGIHGDLPVRFAPDGGAVPGDRIVGILTPGEGITIYPIQSAALSKFEETPERWLDVRWDEQESTPRRFPARINVQVANEPNSLAQITQVIAENDGNIDNIRMTRRAPDFTDVTIDVEVYDLKHLTAIISQLRSKPTVAKAERVNG